jgi:hypothetical protein
MERHGVIFAQKGNAKLRNAVRAPENYGGPGWKITLRPCWRPEGRFDYQLETGRGSNARRKSCTDNQTA